MKQGLTIEVVGLNETIQKLRELGKEKAVLISNAIKGAAIDIVADAENNISGLGSMASEGNAVNLNALRGSIKQTSVSELSVEIGVTVWYAAYIEFGTGDYAAAYLTSQPGEIKEYAMQFYVNGKGTMPARPFFFPAVYKNYNELVKKLISILNK